VRLPDLRRTYTATIAPPTTYAPSRTPACNQLFAVALLVGAVFQSRAALAAERAATAGDEREAARQLRRWTWGWA
jgi:hypothetical protein